MKIVAWIILLMMITMAGFELYFHGNSNIPTGSFYWGLLVIRNMLVQALVFLVLIHETH